jgi:hypothetical protein
MSKLKYGHEVIAVGGVVAYLGPLKKRGGTIADSLRSTKSEAPRGKAYKRMVRNGII